MNSVWILSSVWDHDSGTDTLSTVVVFTSLENALAEKKSQEEKHHSNTYVVIEHVLDTLPKSKWVNMRDHAAKASQAKAIAARRNDCKRA